MTPKPRILIVDDRLDGRITLEAVLESDRYFIDGASSGPEALTLAQNNEYSVIILDVQMPGMDGFETARRLRRSKMTRDTPILFVTAISKDSQFIEEGYAAGAVDYIFKPFEPYVLRSKVAIFVSLFEKDRLLRTQTAELARAQQWNQILIDSAGDVIATTTTDGMITSLNPAFEAVTGFDRKEWIGRRIESGVHRDDLGILLYHLRAAARGEDHDLFETRSLTKSGQYLVLESSVQLLPQLNLKKELLWIARDITERKRAEAESRKRSDLERSNRELEQFAYVCSHDLQEPLRVLLGYSQILKYEYSKELDAAGCGYVDTIVRSTQRMLTLTQELLEYSRLDRPTQFEYLSLDIPLKDALGDLGTGLKESEAEISTHHLPTLRANRTMLSRLFQNLLGNAIKFRGEAPLRIDISAHEEDGEWTIAIRDNGIGFDMQYKDVIFDVFRQINQRERYRGSGMGLSICKRIVEQHGGRIWADSVPGKGSTFYFSIDTEFVDPHSQVDTTFSLHSVVSETTSHDAR